MTYTQQLALCSCVVFMAAFGIGYSVNTIDTALPKHTCNCPTYKDFLNKQAKYEMFVDSLQNNGNKKNRNRLIDSIQKYKL